MPAIRKSTTVPAKPRTKRNRRNSYRPKRPRGRPTAFNPETTEAICLLVAEGSSFESACEKLGVNVSTAYRWMLAQPGFREELYRARQVRGDWAFGEQILDIADNAANDRSYNEKTGKLLMNKELVLRSKIRIEARQFHMSRLQPQQWGDKQQIDIKDDWSLLTEDERRRKAEELIAMIEEIKNPPPGPPPLEYRWQEPGEDDDQPTFPLGTAVLPRSPAW